MKFLKDREDERAILCFIFIYLHDEFKASAWLLRLLLG